MRTFAKRLSGGGFAADGSGATAIEYALVAALIAVAIASAVGLLGTQVSSLFSQVSTAFP